MALRAWASSFRARRQLLNRPANKPKITKIRNGTIGNGAPSSKKSYAVEGDLTIHGVTRKIHFSVEGPTPATKDPWSNRRVAISAITTINREDFGLIWNAALETGGILVGDEVTIALEIELVRAKSAR